MKEWKKKELDKIVDDNYEIVKMLANIENCYRWKDFPETKKTNEAKPKFTLRGLIEKFRPLIEIVFPKRDVTVEKTHENVRDIVGEISDALKERYEVLKAEDKFTINETREDMEIRFCNLNIERTAAEIEQMKQEKGEDYSLLKSYESIKSCYERRLRNAEKKKSLGLGKPTTAHSLDGKVNLAAQYTVADACSIIHELVHSATNGYPSNGILNELPAITAELLADRFGEGKGLGRAHQVPHRLGYLGYYATEKNCGELLKIFDEYKKTGEMKDESKMKDLLYSAQYEIGTCGGIALANRIKSKDELDNVFATINNKKLTDVERIKQMGLTEENMIVAVGDAYKKNRVAAQVDFIFGS